MVNLTPIRLRGIGASPASLGDIFTPALQVFSPVLDMLSPVASPARTPIMVDEQDNDNLIIGLSLVALLTAYLGTSLYLAYLDFHKLSECISPTSEEVKPDNNQCYPEQILLGSVDVQLLA
ncbi:MAG: hypothetical protein RLN62_02980 [Rickettsiales bacterium]